MTRYQPLWEQAGSYAASLDRSLLATIWPSGGAIGGAVTAVANTMTVSVAPGTVAVVLQAGQGCALCRWDAAEVPPALAAAPPSGQSRIDVICAQVRDNALDSGGNNDFIFTVVTGTPAASNPATPATPTNAYAMANVTVPGAAANLNSATITDRRSGIGATAGPRARLYRVGAGSLGANVTNPIALDGVVFDPQKMLQANGTVTLPLAGLYWFAFVITASIVGAGQAVQANLYQGGTVLSLGTIAPAGSATGSATSVGTDLLQFAAGANIQVQVWNGGGATNLAGVGNPAYNFLSIEYRGPLP
jgi:hypothetical protein